MLWLISKFVKHSLSEIEIDGINYKTEKYIGGDLKILAIIFEINRASSNCPCKWCIWDKRKLKNMDIQKVDDEIRRQWSILDPDWGARSKVESSLQSQGQNGYIKSPILNIPFYRVVIDMLHLFLRITNVLYDLFIQDLRNLDGKQKNELDLTNMPHLNQFYTDLKDT